MCKGDKSLKPYASRDCYLTDAPATISPESQEEQAGEQNKAEVADTAEANPITQERTEVNGQDETQVISLI